MGTPQEDRKVPLRVSNNAAYVWDVDDIGIIRSQHRICGVLTGTLPHMSQQNVFLGVPLVLLPEEVVLLVENESAVIINDPSAHLQPDLSSIESWNTEQHAYFRKQIAANEVKASKQETSRSMSEGAMKKRKEREERKRLAAKKLEEESRARDDDTPRLAMDVSQPEVLTATAQEPQMANSGRLAPSANHTITIPAASEYLWYSPDQSTFTTIESAQRAGVWTYPADLKERAKCRVFRSLWAQGYFMGSGIKFGGDFLVYPGDPLRYHSHFVATVLESPSQTLRPMEIVAHGRLGTATKKAHLLCTWDDEKEEVSFLSIEWAGFG